MKDPIHDKTEATIQALNAVAYDDLKAGDPRAKIQALKTLGRLKRQGLLRHIQIAGVGAVLALSTLVPSQAKALDLWGALDKYNQVQGAIGTVQNRNLDPLSKGVILAGQAQREYDRIKMERERKQQQEELRKQREEYAKQREEDLKKTDPNAEKRKQVEALEKELRIKEEARQLREREAQARERLKKLDEGKIPAEPDRASSPDAKNEVDRSR